MLTGRAAGGQIARAETPCDVASGAQAGAARGRPRRGRAGTGMCRQRAVLARVFAPMHARRIVGSDLVPIARGAPRVLRRPRGRGGVCAQKFLARRLDLAYFIDRKLRYRPVQYSSRLACTRAHWHAVCGTRDSGCTGVSRPDRARRRRCTARRRLSTSTVRYGATRSIEALQQGVAAAAVVDGR
jgi:hypothetical protein